MPDSSLHVAVIGLGAMGLPMATHLATTFTVTGFDPFEPRRELASESGVAAEATPARPVPTPTSPCWRSATTRRPRPPCSVRMACCRR